MQDILSSGWEKSTYKQVYSNHYKIIIKSSINACTFKIMKHLVMKKNENLTAHQTHLLDGYISANHRFSTLLDKITTYNPVHLVMNNIANIFIFKQLREQYVKAYYYTQPSYLKFEQLFRSSNNTVLLKLDKFSTLISNEFLVLYVYFIIVIIIIIMFFK